MGDEDVLFREVEVAGDGFDVGEVLGCELCFVDWLGFRALRLVFFVLADDDQVLCAHFVKILFDQLWSPVFH